MLIYFTSFDINSNGNEVSIANNFYRFVEFCVYRNFGKAIQFGVVYAWACAWVCVCVFECVVYYINARLRICVHFISVW